MCWALLCIQPQNESGIDLWVILDGNVLIVRFGVHDIPGKLLVLSLVVIKPLDCVLVLNFPKEILGWIKLSVLVCEVAILILLYDVLVCPPYFGYQIGLFFIDEDEI